MKKLFAIGCLMMVGCNSIVPITTQNGKQGYAIQCNSGQDACGDFALRACPKGYAVISGDVAKNSIVVECLEPSKQ